MKEGPSRRAQPEGACSCAPSDPSFLPPHNLTLQRSSNCRRSSPHNSPPPPPTHPHPPTPTPTHIAVLLKLPQVLLIHSNALQQPIPLLLCCPGARLGCRQLPLSCRQLLPGVGRLHLQLCAAPLQRLQPAD